MTDSRRGFGNLGEDGVHARTVSWSIADVVETYDSIGVDEYVSAELREVGSGEFESAPFGEELEVDAPCRESVEVPPIAALHAIGAIETAGRVDEERPFEVGGAYVGLRERVRLEGDDGDFDVPFG